MPINNYNSFSSEAALIEKIRLGDRKAFEIIFYKYNQDLLIFAKRELKSNELAKDAVQDVFVKLWVKRHKLKPADSIKGFLFTCLKNQILNAIRTQKNRILKHTKFVDQKIYESLPADNEIMTTEYNLALNNFISKIPKSKQRILELSMQGYKNKEISQQVNLSSNTVKMYLSDIKKRINTFVLDPKTTLSFLLLSAAVG